MLEVVSADMGVDVRRVSAVVRMKEMEKQWLNQVSPRRETILSPLSTASMMTAMKTMFD